MGKKHFVSFKPARPGTEPRTLAWKAAFLHRVHTGATQKHENFIRCLCYCRPSVEDNGPKLTQHWVNVSCMLEIYSRDDSIYYVWKVKCFLPAHSWRFNIVGSLRDREAVCLASDRQGSNFESCVWSAVSSHYSHHLQKVFLVQFSLYGQKWPKTPFILFLYVLKLTRRPVHSAKLKCSICLPVKWAYTALGLCLLVKWADTAFWVCKAVNVNFIRNKTMWE